MMCYGQATRRQTGASEISTFYSYKIQMCFKSILFVAFGMCVVTQSHGDTLKQTEAIKRLTRVFGIKKIPGRVFHKSPPQYMTELYNSVTDTGGLTKATGPYNANTVRSFPDKDTVHRMHFYYNISYVDDSYEKILEAEFHVFKMRPRPAAGYEPRPPHVIEITIYQVMDVNQMYSPSGARLLDKKIVGAYSHGWFVFKVTKAVEEWVNKTSPNNGFLITTTSVNGRHVNGSYIRFAQRREHHDSKQPILVIYTDDGMPRHPSFISPDDEGYLEIKQDIARHEKLKEARRKQFLDAVRQLNERGRAGKKRKLRSKRSLEFNIFSRSKRDVSRSRDGKVHKPRRDGKRRKQRRAVQEYYRYRQRRRTCARDEMYVDFDEIGWSGWIISPKGYNAYHCKGECPFPLGQSQKPTNHATVQSIVHALRVGKDVSTPCCVPNKLYSISLLYFDDDENVILKQYDDMVAASCGCH